MTYFPEVSVIVPVYNGATTIEDCIESLLALDYPREKMELLVVDNASTDQTPELLRRHGDTVRIVSEQKRGPAAARNKGVHHARGKVVAFTDADCVVDRRWLQCLVGPLQDLHTGIVGGKILAKRPYTFIEKFGEQIHDHDAAINLYRPPYVITMNWASRLEVLKAFHFDEALRRGEDGDLSYRIFQAGYRFVYQPDAVIYHQNERTLAGLFREGFQHGFYAVPVIKKHHAFVKQFGHRRFIKASYLALAASLWRYVRGEDVEASLCSFVFNTGKKIGKIFGSARFCYVDV
jgi:glycosyltransferase involved in cell wall biosynthesis